MNIHHLRYALAVMKTGSITKAAESLYVSQPNLSSSLKDLEQEIGITLFRRTRAGVETTTEGARFILQAEAVIDQFENLENLYTKQKRDKITLRFVSTRFSPGAESLISYVQNLQSGIPVNIHYRETSHFGVVDALIRGEADVGRIFFENTQLHYFKNITTQHNLTLEVLMENQASLLMSADSELAKKDRITPQMLMDYIVVRYSELENSNWNYAQLESRINMQSRGRCINVSDRATLMEVLESCPNCYFWILGTTPKILKRYNLVQRKCEGVDIYMSEALLYPEKKPLSVEALAAIQHIREQKSSAAAAEPDRKSVV